MENKSLKSIQDKIRSLNNPNLEKLLLKSFDEYKMKGGNKSEENNDEDDEETYKRDIIFENFSGIPIDKFRSLNEFKKRDKFNKWLVIDHDDKSKKQSNFWFF
tara:strand:+ start:1819 stop:2127 length:309 start_codon:yes stop_codon:yes gene_type:complete